MTRLTKHKRGFILVDSNGNNGVDLRDVFLLKFVTFKVVYVLIVQLLLTVKIGKVIPWNLKDKSEVNIKITWFLEHNTYSFISESGDKTAV